MIGAGKESPQVVRGKKNRLAVAFALAFGVLFALACGNSFIAAPTPTSAPPIVGTAILSTVLPASTFTLPTATAAATRPTVAPPSATEYATPSPFRTVTNADNGKTIELQVGERFLLTLSSGYEWEVSVADPAIVSQVVGIQVPYRTQGIYEARQPGRTTIEAVGDLPCRKAKPPCLAPSLLLRIDLVVR
ncbi:MAG: protease inhibitor I42 family protein [Chloroflexi bacterium]|nr:protease inhibitor I42 family protein [Chloroflexota bacterium]